MEMTCGCGSSIWVNVGKFLGDSFFRWHRTPNDELMTRSCDHSLKLTTILLRRVFSWIMSPTQLNTATLHCVQLSALSATVAVVTVFAVPFFRFLFNYYFEWKLMVQFGLLPIFHDKSVKHKRICLATDECQEFYLFCARLDWLALLLHRILIVWNKITLSAYRLHLALRRLIIVIVRAEGIKSKIKSN